MEIGLRVLVRRSSGTARVAGVGLIWATMLFTAGAVGLVGTWAVTTAAIVFAAAAVLLVTALDQGPTPAPAARAGTSTR